MAHTRRNRHHLPGQRADVETPVAMFSQSLPDLRRLNTFANHGVLDQCNSGQDGEIVQAGCINLMQVFETSPNFLDDLSLRF